MAQQHNASPTAEPRGARASELSLGAADLLVRHLDVVSVRLRRVSGELAALRAGLGPGPHHALAERVGPLVAELSALRTELTRFRREELGGR